MAVAMLPVHCDISQSRLQVMSKWPQRHIQEKNGDGGASRGRSIGLWTHPGVGGQDLGSLGSKRGPVDARDVLGWATDHACTRARTSHTRSGDYAAVRHRGDMNDRSRTLTSGAGYSNGDGVWRRSDSTAIRCSR
jgi:hypothetical protein